MNITEQTVKSVVHDIRADFNQSASLSGSELQFETVKEKARNQMRGVLKVVTAHKVASFVLVEMGSLKSVQYGGEQ
jgi:hypothetical protein